MLVHPSYCSCVAATWSHQMISYVKDPLKYIFSSLAVKVDRTECLLQDAGVRHKFDASVHQSWLNVIRASMAVTLACERYLILAHLIFQWSSKILLKYDYRYTKKCFVLCMWGGRAIIAVQNTMSLWCWEFEIFAFTMIFLPPLQGAPKLTTLTRLSSYLQRSGNKIVCWWQFSKWHLFSGYI